MGVCGSKQKPGDIDKTKDPKGIKAVPEKEGQKGKDDPKNADPSSIKEFDKEADNNKKATIGELIGLKPTDPAKKDDPQHKPAVGNAK